MVKNRPKWWLPVAERILGGIISAEGKKLIFTDLVTKFHDFGARNLEKIFFPLGAFSH